MSITISQVREDLKEIRYYYSMKELFDSAANTVKPVVLLNKVAMYNEAMKSAPGRLFVIYVSLYVHNNSQTALADDWGFGREYIKDLNQRLVEYLQKALS